MNLLVFGVLLNLATGEPIRYDQIDSAACIGLNACNQDYASDSSTHKKFESVNSAINFPENVKESIYDEDSGNYMSKKINLGKRSDLKLNHDVVLNDQVIQKIDETIRKSQAFFFADNEKEDFKNVLTTAIKKCLASSETICPIDMRKPKELLSAYYTQEELNERIVFVFKEIEPSLGRRVEFFYELYLPKFKLNNLNIIDISVIKNKTKEELEKKSTLEPTNYYEFMKKKFNAINSEERIYTGNTSFIRYFAVLESFAEAQEFLDKENNDIFINDAMLGVKKYLDNDEILLNDRIFNLKSKVTKAYGTILNNIRELYMYKRSLVNHFSFEMGFNDTTYYGYV